MVNNHGKAPIYDLDLIRQLILDEWWDPATPRCTQDINSLGLSRSQVREILLAVTAADYKKSHPAAGSKFGDIPVDSYVICFDEGRRVRCREFDATVVLYVKFGVVTNDQGDLCAVVSFHPEGRYR